MNTFLRLITIGATIGAAIVACVMACMVIVGLIPVIALFAWFWNTQETRTPQPAPGDAKELDDKFWALVLWNEQHPPHERHGDV